MRKLVVVIILILFLFFLSRFIETYHLATFLDNSPNICSSVSGLAHHYWLATVWYALIIVVLGYEALLDGHRHRLRIVCVPSSRATDLQAEDSVRQYLLEA